MKTPKEMYNEGWCESCLASPAVCIKKERCAGYIQESRSLDFYRHPEKLAAYLTPCIMTNTGYKYSCPDGNCFDNREDAITHTVKWLLEKGDDEHESDSAQG